MEADLPLQLAGLALLLLVSGFFSGSEAAIFSLPRLKLRQMKEQGVRSAARIMHLLEDPRRLLITILFCNLLVNTLISSLATVIALSLARQFQLSEGVALAAMTVFLTYVLIVFGEVTPINIGLNYAANFSRLASIPLSAISAFLTRFFPIQPLLTRFTDLVIPLFGGETGGSMPYITKAELNSTIALGAADDFLAPTEQEIIRSIFSFSETTVREIMTPRIDVIACRSTASVHDALQIFRAEGFNRLPVYDRSIDNIVGIVHIKDLLPFIRDIERQRVTKIRTLARDPYFVPSTKKIDVMLADFQSRNIQMAVVIDEYGGTEGIVTMEDVLEEIVGEIQDEYDEEPQPFTKLSENSYVMDAGLSVDELNDLFGVAIDEEGVESIGGLVLHLLGRLPAVGERVSFQNLQFEIKAIQGFRILKVVVRKLRENPPPPQDAEAMLA